MRECAFTQNMWTHSYVESHKKNTCNQLLDKYYCKLYTLFFYKYYFNQH